MNPSRPAKPESEKSPAIAVASVSETLATLRVNPATGLAAAEIGTRRQESGFNEVLERKSHPVSRFLRKFWGLSAGMLELIMVLSALLGKYSDLAVVGALLVINAAVSFYQEQRTAGVVEALRRRLRVNVRVLRDSIWSGIPARELVPGDIIRIRSGDIVPADVKLLSGLLSADQSALTGESFDVEKAPGEILSSGSVVRHGEGDGVVMLTGSKTYFGRTTELVQGARPKLNLGRRGQSRRPSRPYRRSGVVRRAHSFGVPRYAARGNGFARARAFDERRARRPSRDADGGHLGGIAGTRPKGRPGHPAQRRRGRRDDEHALRGQDRDDHDEPAFGDGCDSLGEEHGRGGSVRRSGSVPRCQSGSDRPCVHRGGRRTDHAGRPDRRHPGVIHSVRRQNPPDGSRL